MWTRIKVRLAVKLRSRYVKSSSSEMDKGALPTHPADGGRAAPIAIGDRGSLPQPFSPIPLRKLPYGPSLQRVTR